MTQQSLVTLEREGSALSILTLNRPEKKNALSIALMERLCQAVEAVAKDRSQRVLVLKGAGNVFCTGMDLQEGAQVDKAEFFAQMVARTLRTVHEAPVVTIAAVEGYAVAGGAGLMSACDFVLAEKGAKIGFPEVRRGLVAVLVTILLRRQIQDRHLRELLLAGELVTAVKAKEIGLITQVSATSEDLMKDIRHLAGEILKGGPEAVRNTKAILNEGLTPLLEEEFQQAITGHLGARKSAEAQEGIQAFLEKRSPRWV